MTIPHPTYSRYIYISTHQYGIHAHLVSRAKAGVWAGEEKGWGVYLLRPRAQCAAGCSMWRAGAVSWPRSARVTHRTLHTQHSSYAPGGHPPPPYNWEYAEL